MKGWQRRSKFATFIKKTEKKKTKRNLKKLLHVTENQRQIKLRKSMKGWQRRSKFATLIKKNKENKNKKKFKKAFACEKESFLIRNRELKTKNNDKKHEKTY